MYDRAKRFEGLAEKGGRQSNPLVMAMLKMRVQPGGLIDFDGWPGDDEVPWCGAAMQFWAVLEGFPVPPLPLRARSWLQVGRPIAWRRARMGNDFVVLKRGPGDQPGPEVLDAPGHVGLYAGHTEAGAVLVLGGNQGDRLCVRTFSMSDVLGDVRRLGLR